MKASSRSIFAVVLSIVGILLLICARAVSIEAAYPVERANRMFCQKVWTRVVGLFKGSEACAENVRLRREVAALAILRTDVERLESENDRLRQALDYRACNSMKWLAAGVLSTGGGAAARDTVRVDKGSLAGVEKGAVVAVPEGLVGRVMSVTPHTSEIAIITDSRIKVSCEVETEGKGAIRGILCGGNEESLNLRHLTDAADVPARSRVLTSGLGGVFPKGLEVGTLLCVRKSASRLACEGEVQPAVDYSSLEDVFIRCEK